ncbi:hypothetical protein DU508_21710 [Pedobacter chinensis]|uniref:DUF4276 family protein n=1 Tax=Pedobacter chinensis TaxID=2282421 RepID=A0A369PP09_9SPHI|nr:hypothetical protein [Pedobacter chinensis]RDC54341.1 hypothetical protein DU508_21710 [Pedobacter chinensis]
MAGKLIVIFVEGETEKEFYNALIQYYKAQSSNKLREFKVINLGGINRFETKMALKLQNEILVKHNPKDVEVVCCYDTDVFEFAKRPPVNWTKVKSRVADLGISELTQVMASRMIEDWFLADLPGICKFLKIKEVKKADGKDGNDKMIKLFKKGSKLYIKGTPTSKFIPSLNMETIRKHAASQLSPLEKLLHVSLAEKGKQKKKK